MGLQLPWNCACISGDDEPQRRSKIDRSMIGQPTNFQHTGHIGSNDMGTSVTLTSVKTQMESKGGAGDNAAPTEAAATPGIRAISLEEARAKLAEEQG
eukprot:m.59030 g.59030  ORF g.59030 m.59030 type:complete len:98 (-) comp12927_c0_seq1:408-701(-)